MDEESIKVMGEQQMKEEHRILYKDILYIQIKGYERNGLDGWMGLDYDWETDDSGMDDGTNG